MKRSILFICALFALATLANISATEQTEQLVIGDENKALEMGQAEQAKQPKQAEEQKADIYLNFENASLESVLNYLAEQKNINIIPHAKLKGPKVSLTTRHPLTIDQAWNILYTLLEVNGFTIINVNGIFRVVTLKESQQNPLPVYSSSKGVSPKDLPDSDELVRYIYFCRNIKSATAQGILSKMLAPKSVQINKDLEACIITEKSQSIKGAMKIVEELDQGGLREAIKIIELKHTTADNVAKLFNKDILGGGNKNKRSVRFSKKDQKNSSYFSSEIKLIPEATHNSLILMGSVDSINKIIAFIDKYIDVPIGSAQSRLHIKEIKYMAAEKIKALLEKILRPPKGQRKEKTTLEGSFKFFEDVIIVAETPRDGGSSRGVGAGNRLIISAGNEDWIRLNQFIDRLDIPQPQVALEIMIVDIKMDNERQLGAQVRLPEKTTMGSAIGMYAMNTAAAGDLKNLHESVMSAASGPASSIISLGDTAGKDVWGLIKAMYKVDNSNVISQPFLIANNNTRCEEEISESRFVDGGFTNSGNGNSTQTVKQVREKAEIRTSILPRINASGVIDLAVDIKVSEFQTNTDSSPDKTTRSIKTHALMYTGEVLVIGGLNDTTKAKKSFRTPILSQIPIIGNLFKSRKKTSLEKNLYVFIRPSIIKPHFSGHPDDYTQLKMDFAKYQVLKTEEYDKLNDPIQRWFFKPEHQSIKQKLSDLAEGKMRIMDAFAEKKNSPRETQINKDPYFRSQSISNTGRSIAREFRDADQPRKSTLVRPSKQEVHARVSQAHQQVRNSLKRRSHGVQSVQNSHGSTGLSESTLAGLVAGPTPTV